MVFNSLTFVVFFILVFCVYQTLSNWNYKKALLLIMSYVFYGAWNPWFVILLWVSTVIDWFTAKFIYEAKDKSRKKVWMVLSLFSNLGLLAYFKYGIFFMKNVKLAADYASFSADWTELDIILPVGISFYTFQTLSYTLDIYRGNLKPARTFLDFALYVTFFPQLVAGPIVRAVDFIPQCEEPKKATPESIGWGLYLMTLGIFQKVVLADIFLAPSSDKVFGWVKSPVHFFDSWIGLLGFTGQVFFDFTGYSTCAIGAALCFGFSMPDNFHFPFSAIGFSDLWNRWHISLTHWLRDYLYVSLGGNRKGKSRTLFNMFITMLLGGLWHGAAWTYIIWGALHGSFLIIEQFLKKWFGGLNLIESVGGRAFLRIITLIFFMLPLVFFRSNNVSHALTIFSGLWGIGPAGLKILPTIEIVKVLVAMTSIISIHWYLSNTHIENAMGRAPKSFVVITWTLMLFALVISQGGSNAFIYFQF